MCPTPAKRVTLRTCICRNSAAAFALTGFSENCGDLLGESGAEMRSRFIRLPVGARAPNVLGVKHRST
jgi:hypothetical protein